MERRLFLPVGRWEDGVVVGGSKGRPSGGGLCVRAACFCWGSGGLAWGGGRGAAPRFVRGRCEGLR